MSRGTDRRTVRIAPELWERAGRVAVSNDETLSDVMRRALEDYARASTTGGTMAATATKVYGMIVPTPNGIELHQERHIRQCRAVVATASKASAVRALDAAGIHVSLHEFNGYAGITGNDTEVAVATSEPGCVFVGPVSCGRLSASDYVRVPFLVPMVN